MLVKLTTFQNKTTYIEQTIVILHDPIVLILTSVHFDVMRSCNMSHRHVLWLRNDVRLNQILVLVLGGGFRPWFYKMLISAF